MIKALIFDFDGLMVDTETPYYQSWSEIYRGHGCELPLADYVASIGRGALQVEFNPYTYLEQQLGRPIVHDDIRATHRTRYRQLMQEPALLPGIASYIAEARRLGLKLGVASSSSREWVGGYLSRLDILSTFDIVKCGDEVANAKPDPDLYLAVLDTLGVRADEAIAFEDSPNGAWAAKRAGIYCVVVPNSITADLPLDHANLRLASLADTSLEQLLRLVADAGLDQQPAD